MNEDAVKAYLTHIDNDNTYDNSAKALKHPSRMYNTDISISFRKPNTESLIITPKYDMVRELIESVQDPLVKACLALCSTTGIRVRRLLSLDDIDFNNGPVLRKVEYVTTKWYDLIPCM